MGNLIDSLNTNLSRSEGQEGKIYLYKPSRNFSFLKNIFSEIVQTDKFPIEELLAYPSGKQSYSTNDTLIFLEQQHLVDLHYWITVFHHKVIIIKKGDREQEINSFRTETQNELTKPHSPVYLSCYTYCLSVTIKQLSNLFGRKYHIVEEESKGELDLPQASKRDGLDLTPINGSYSRNKMVQLLSTYNLCCQNSAPGSLILENISASMTRRILNMLSFYQLNIIKYPSLDVFIAGCCKSNKIICGAQQLESMVGRVVNEEYPSPSNAPLSVTQNSNGASELATNIECNKTTEIIIYCFCAQNQIKKFTEKSAPLCGKNMVVKFHNNMISLVKEYIRDKNVEIIQKICLTLYRNEHKEFIQSHDKSVVRGSMQGLKQKKVLKTLRNIRMKNILSRASLNLHSLCEEEKKETLIFFFIHEKEKDILFLKSFPKKLARSLKNLKIKVYTRVQKLIEKIKHQQVSIILIDESPKIYLEFCQQLEFHSIEDKVILIKRKEIQNVEQFSKKIAETIERGLLKDEKNAHFNFLNKHLIVMGSKDYLKHIISKYPFLKIKEFIDITNQKYLGRVHEIIGRKNEIVISKTPICDCNSEYKGLIKANIVHYEWNTGRNGLFLTCGCKSDDLSQKSLTNLLEEVPSLLVNFNYNRKKISFISNQIKNLLNKIKDKRYLKNHFEGFEYEYLFISSDPWIVDQIATLIIKAMSNRYLNNWLCPAMKDKIIYDCCRQITDVIKLEIQTSFAYFKSEKDSKELFEEAANIYNKIGNSQMSSSTVLDFSTTLLRLFAESQLFRVCLNYLWRNLISLNRNEYPSDFSSLLLVILMGFRKSESLNSRTDQTFSQPNPSNKMFLRLLSFQKGPQQNLCRFFSAKLGGSSYIYSTQFLLFERISSEEIEPIFLKGQSIQRSQKHYNAVMDPSSIFDLRSSKDIQQKYSTENQVIICVENINLLSFEFYQPLHRVSHQWQGKITEKYVIPPFTKMQFNKENSYRPFNHYLKLSLSMHQKFLQKTLQTFIIDKSCNSSEVSTGQVMMKRSNVQRRKLCDNINLLNEGFQIHPQDKFFILMNQCKYFSAHNLLIENFDESHLKDTYHAILLSRKGLYYEALKVLLQSNPLKSIIYNYVEQLQNRVKQIDMVDSGSQVSKAIKSGKRSWKVSFNSEEEKFILTDLEDTCQNFRYNNDSLSVVYQQVIENENRQIFRNCSLGDSKIVNRSCTKQSSINILKEKRGYRKTMNLKSKNSKITFSQTSSNPNFIIFPDLLRKSEEQEVEQDEVEGEQEQDEVEGEDEEEEDEVEEQEEEEEGNFTKMVLRPNVTHKSTIPAQRIDIVQRFDLPLQIKMDEGHGESLKHLDLSLNKKRSIKRPILGAKTWNRSKFFEESEKDKYSVNSENQFDSEPLDSSKQALKALKSKQYLTTDFKDANFIPPINEKQVKSIKQIISSKYSRRIHQNLNQSNLNDTSEINFQIQNEGSLDSNKQILEQDMGQGLGPLSNDIFCINKSYDDDQCQFNIQQASGKQKHKEVRSPSKKEKIKIKCKYTLEFSSGDSSDERGSEGEDDLNSDLNRFSEPFSELKSQEGLFEQEKLTEDSQSKKEDGTDHLVQRDMNKVLFKQKFKKKQKKLTFPQAVSNRISGDRDSDFEEQSGYSCETPDSRIYTREISRKKKTNSIEKRFDMMNNFHIQLMSNSSLSLLQKNDLHRNSQNYQIKHADTDKSIQTKQSGDESSHVTPTDKKDPLIRKISREFLNSSWCQPINTISHEKVIQFAKVHPLNQENDPHNKENFASGQGSPFSKEKIDSLLKNGLGEFCNFVKVETQGNKSFPHSPNSNSNREENLYYSIGDKKSQSISNYQKMKKPPSQNKKQSNKQKNAEALFHHQEWMTSSSVTDRIHKISTQKFHNTQD